MNHSFQVTSLTGPSGVLAPARVILADCSSASLRNRRAGILCVLVSGFGSCEPPADRSASAPPAASPLSDADIAAAEADAAVSGDDFAFGPVDETGISIGLMVENPQLRKGEKVRYDIALRNSGPARVHRWLGVPRHCFTRLMAREADGATKTVGALSENHTITMLVDPQETRARPGTRFELDVEGSVELYLIYGGQYPYFVVEEVSGMVKVEVAP